MHGFLVINKLYLAIMKFMKYLMCFTTTDLPNPRSGKTKVVVVLAVCDQPFFVLINQGSKVQKLTQKVGRPRLPQTPAMLLVCLAEPGCEVRDEVTTSYFK